MNILILTKNKKMLMIIAFIPALMLTMLCVGGCEKANTEPTDIEMPISILEVPCGFKWNDWQNLGDSLLIINNNEELNEYFDCEENLQINFSEKTVLLAFGNAAGCIVDKTASLSQNNTSNTLNVEITITDIFTINGEKWVMVIVTDKINSNNVSLNVVINLLPNY
jgi:hypothetical protein